MAEKAKLLPAELALGALCIELPTAEDLKHLLDIEKVLLQQWQVHQTIVHVHQRAPAQRARRPRDSTMDWRQGWSVQQACRGSCRTSREIKAYCQCLIHDPHQQ